LHLLAVSTEEIVVKKKQKTKLCLRIGVCVAISVVLISTVGDGIFTFAQMRLMRRLYFSFKFIIIIITIIEFVS